MRPVGTGGQQRRDLVFDASGSVTGGAAAATLLLPESKSRSMIVFINLSDVNMYLGIGCARAQATLTSGVVTGVTITNAGFGFTRPPKVLFRGGGSHVNFAPQLANSSFIGAAGINGDPTWPAPQKPAQGTAVLTSNAVSAVTIDDGGAGYVTPPYVQIVNDDLDPSGCFDPSVGSGAAGSILVPSNGQVEFSSGSLCPTDAIAVWAAGTGAGKKFTLLWMD